MTRSKTITQLNNFENFQYPSISYKYIENSNNELEVNVLLIPKKKFSLGFGIDLMMVSNTGSILISKSKCGLDFL